MMKISIETGVYNEKRYGKPWIAKVSFQDSKQGTFQFGDWIGQEGGQGVLELDDVQIGDVVARGQKDFRNPKNSAPCFYVVRSADDLEHVSKLDAYKHWQASLTKPVSVKGLEDFTSEDLLKELIARGWKPKVEVMVQELKNLGYNVTK